MILDVANGVPIETEIARRGIKLFGRGERVGPCPVCGGRDRFSINSKKQVWNCRGCGRGGDVIAMVQHLDGCDFPTAIRTLASEERAQLPVNPVAKPSGQDAARFDLDNIERALRIWDDAGAIDGTPAEQYLRRRGLEPPGEDSALRYFSPCPFGPGVTYPCLIALFRDITTNEPRAIHRIALAPGGIAIGKMMLGPVAGCAIKLDPDENVEGGLTISEGLETGVAGRQLGFRPAWALGSAGAIKTFPVRPGIEALTILVDNDPADHNGRHAGQEAALACSKRWTMAGCEVTRVVPRRPGADLADLVGGRHERRE